MFTRYLAEESVTARILRLKGWSKADLTKPLSKLYNNPGLTRLVSRIWADEILLSCLNISKPDLELYLNDNQDATLSAFISRFEH
jgi:hypothetical protein